jgi:effector-binding domain-containing protein
MRPLSILLSVLLAFSFVAIGCEKKTEGPPAAEPMTPPDKAEAPAEGEAKAEAPAEPAVKLDPEVQKILDAAIEAHGGLEKVMATKSMRSKGTARNPKNPKQTLYTWHGSVKMGHTHGALTTPSGGTFILVRGPEHCWYQKGPVVMPCIEKEKKLTLALAAIQTAQYLWPLKELGWEIEAGKTKVGGKELDRLTIKWPEIDAEGYLDFDPESHLLSQLTCKTSDGKGYVITNAGSEYKEYCGGFKSANKWTASDIEGKPIELIEFTDITCEPVDDKIFEQPEQVADGTIEEKESSAHTVACTKMKGPYENTGKTIEKLVGFIKKQKLSADGKPMMIYLKGPPKVKKAKKYLTEICIPVEAKAPKKPKKKGKFVIKAMKPRKVLAAYGVGPYEKKAPELMKLLMAEAKKRKLKPAGPMCQISFMDPKETAAEELVSEMQIPIKGGKKKKK